MTATQMIGGHGAIVIPCTDEAGKSSNVTFTIAPLTIGDELVLHAELKAIAESERKDKRNSMLTQLNEVPNFGLAHRTFVTELVQYEMLPINGYEIGQIRETLQGTRIELWHRARKTNPNLTREQVDACLNLETWANAREEMNKIIRPGPKDTKS